MNHMRNHMMEDFTLPHRVSLDSTWSPRGVVESSWSPRGVFMDFPLQEALPNSCIKSLWSPDGLLVGSMQAPCGPCGLQGLPLFERGKFHIITVESQSFARGHVTLHVMTRSRHTTYIYIIYFILYFIFYLILYILFYFIFMMSHD